MSAYRGIVVVYLLTWALMQPLPAAAQVSSAIIPVAVGQTVSVTVADGRTVKGNVSLVTPGSIELAGTRIAASDVLRVRERDSLGNGAGTGALIVGLVGALLGAGADGLSDAFGSSSNGSYFLAGVGIGLVSGAAIGAGLDALHNKTIYERRDSGMSVGLRPIVSNGGKGLGVSVRW